MQNAGLVNKPIGDSLQNGGSHIGDMIMSRSILFVIVLLLALITLTACGAASTPMASTLAPTSMLLTTAPTNTPVSTDTPASTNTPKPTNTLRPTNTPAPISTPTATPDLSVPMRIPLPGDNATSWGWRHSIQIWGTDFGPYDCHNTGVLDFICDADVDPVTGLPYSKTGRSMHYWNENAPMTFEGQVPLEITPKTVTVYFEEPVQNVAITSGPGDIVYIDSIVGITLDGTKIPIGFTLDENGLLVPAPLFFDGYASGVGTYLQAERNLMAPPVCGMVGLQNDSNYTEMGGFRIGTADGHQVDVGSFILFRLPQTPASQLTNNDLWAARGVKAFEIAALEITVLYNYHPDRICP